MHIQSYQIHNVLNVYRRQLSQNKSTSSVAPRDRTSEMDAVTISDDGKKQSIMEKVAASVIERITKIDPQNGEGEFESGKPAQQSIPLDWQTSQHEHAFTFNTLVGNNQKETRSIVIDDSQVLMNRLDELAKAAVDQAGD